MDTVLESLVQQHVIIEPINRFESAWSETNHGGRVGYEPLMESRGKSLLNLCGWRRRVIRGDNLAILVKIPDQLDSRATGLLAPIPSTLALDNPRLTNREQYGNFPIGFHHIRQCVCHGWQLY